MSVFADSGGWLSVLITNDRYHQIGKRYLESSIQARIVILTTDYVLDEVVTRIRYDTGYRKAVEFLDLVHQAEGSGVLQIAPVTRELRGRAEEVFRQYKDVKLSFTDCTSFAFLEAYRVSEVFGFDSHFEMMGYILNPKV